MVLKRFDPVSCAKITGTLYACFGLLIGAVISLISVLGGFASARPGGVALGAFLGAGAVLLAPICYGAIGFVFTLIGALLYNGVAKLVGGIRFEVE